MTSRSPVILLELNEVNFDYVRRYAARGRLPTFARLMDRYGVVETTSEDRYEHLEPWIQWVTAHTGKPFAEHGVFRLGDIVAHDLPQIWEVLEEAGLSVAAVSPINAANRTRRSPFFVPDPWTQTPSSGGWILRGLHRALMQAVGDNASRKITLRSAAWLLAGIAAHFRASTAADLFRLAARHRRCPWTGSLFLDRFLADVFVRRWRSTRPDFASLFLNAAAHVQHHYMFSSIVYDGPHRNPAWYVGPAEDPVLEAYTLYDRILADVLRLPGEPRVIVATGLHQDPYPEAVFYYRLKDHAAFLQRLGIRFSSVQPRMSRDFTVYCASADDARHATAVLSRVLAPGGETLFSVDNRGTDLFAMLVYPHEIGSGFVATLDGTPIGDLHGDVAFVALKNGEHNGVGYLVDTRDTAGKDRFELAEVFTRVCAAFDVHAACRSSLSTAA